MANLCEEIEQLVEKGKQCFICSPNEILINGKPMEQVRDVADSLIERAIVKGENSGTQLLDFSDAQYKDEIQDILLKHIYGCEFELTKEQFEAIQYYKGPGFENINNFMRGNFNKVDFNNVSIDKIVEMILSIDNLGKTLPTREYDIVLNRIGAGRNKEINIGAINSYESFVSFGTNEGTAIGEIRTVKYRKILKKDEPAIPVEQIYSLEGYLPECEVLTLPFMFSILDISQPEEKGYKQIYMGNEKQLSIEEILLKRLNEYNQFQNSSIEEQEDNGKRKEMVSIEIKNAIEVVTKYKENTNVEKVKVTPLKYFDDDSKEEEYNPNDLISQVVEGEHNQPRLTVIKQIINKIKNVLTKELNEKEENENGTNR